jgi:hypothetical protein
MHFCFWDHLHLSTCLKVIDALQCSPYVSLILHFSPLLLPPSLPPLLPLCCTPPPAPGPERRPAALRPSAPRSTRRAALSSTALVSPAGSSPECHAACGTASAARRHLCPTAVAFWSPPRSGSNPRHCLLLPSSSFPVAYKTLHRVLLVHPSAAASPLRRRAPVRHGIPSSALSLPKLVAYSPPAAPIVPPQLGPSFPRTPERRLRSPPPAAVSGSRRPLPFGHLKLAQDHQQVA